MGTTIRVILDDWDVTSAQVDGTIELIIPPILLLLFDNDLRVKVLKRRVLLHLDFKVESLTVHSSSAAQIDVEASCISMVNNTARLVSFSCFRSFTADQVSYSS